MKLNIKIWPLIGITFFSAHSLANDWTKCRSMSDNTERLACYDRWVDANQTTATVRNITSTEDSEVNQATPVLDPPKSAVKLAPVIASTTPSERTEKLHSEQTFGMERKIAESEQLDEIHTSFEGEFTGWEAKQEFTLANGQVWRIADGSTGYHRISNPNIRIKRGVFGVFFMTIEGLNKSPKVKRVK